MTEKRELRQGDLVSGLTATGGEWAILSLWTGSRNADGHLRRYVVAVSESGKRRKPFDLTGLELRDAGPAPTAPTPDARRWRVGRP